MKKHKFSETSKKNMMGVHPDLIFLAYELIKQNKIDLIIIKNGGLRNYQQQLKLYKKGYSKTLNSYHQYGLALDIVLYIKKPTWAKKHKTKYKEMVKLALKIIKENNLNISHPLKWDLPHFQMKLNKKDYKKNG